MKVHQPGYSGPIDTSLIRENPINPREWFDPELLDGLANTYKGVGQIHDAVVMLLPPDMRGDQPYMLLDGARRFRSSKKARKPLNARVIEWIPDKIQQLLLSGVANSHGVPLSDLEEALLFSKLYDGGKGLGLDQIGKLFGGKKGAQISVRIQVVEQCPPAMLELMHPRRPKKQRLSMDRAYSILVGLRGHPEEMLKEAREVIKKGTSQETLKYKLRIKGAQLGITRQRGRYRPADTRKQFVSFLDKTTSVARLLIAVKKGLLTDALETGDLRQARRMAKQARDLGPLLAKLADNIDAAADQHSKN